MAAGADEMEDLEDVFLRATKHVRQISPQLAPDKLLYFYARFKQANEGQCKSAKPSFFDFQGKAKWEAWYKLGDMSKKQAMMEYVSLLSNIDGEWINTMEHSDEHSKHQSEHQCLGVSVSIMASTGRELTDREKTVFDWCQEGNVDKVKLILLANAAVIDSLDQEGLSLLHWASDRGNIEMAKILLSLGADINRQDKDQQTALHYAVSCEHRDMAEVLVRHGIDVSLKDLEGNTALDIASDDMKLLIQRHLTTKS